MAVTHPHLIKEWHPTKNEIKPEEVVSGTTKKIWWLCKRCGHEWKIQVRNRAIGTGCPKCADRFRTSFGEKAVAYYLAKAIDIVEQYPLKSSTMSLDVFIPNIKVGIEYDGRKWHQDAKKDKKKDKLCNEMGITLYRIREKGCVDISDSSSIIYEINEGSESDLEITIDKLISLLTFKKITININNDRIKIEELIARDFEENSLQSKLPELCEEWHPTKNGTLYPKNFLWKSGKKVWWLRSKCSYEWEATIHNRSNGNGCPACSGRVATKWNNFKVTHSHLAEEWHLIRNKLTPEQVVSGSGHKVWWTCSTCSHEWEATIYSRTKGSGCPKCGRKKQGEARRKNKLHEKSLALKRPELCNEWHPTKNGTLLPKDFAYKSGHPAWWKCSNCSHEWKAMINNRSNGTGCPECAKKKMIETRRKNQLLKEQSSVQPSI